MTLPLCLALIGCGPSIQSSNVASYKLTDLPPSVYAESARVVVLPKSACDKGCVKRLVVSLRKSELRKVRALKSAIAGHAKQRAYLAKRGKNKG